MEKSSETLRQCVVTRDQLEVDELIRFVIGPENQVVPDIKRKLPGRGVWVTAEEQKVEIAVKKHLFSKAFKQKVHIPSDLAKQIRLLLQLSALQQLALVNKAGELVLGFAKVDAALSRKDILALIHASTASLDSCGKLGKKWRGILGDHQEAFRVVNCFSEEQLGRTLGRDTAVHMALVSGGASNSFLRTVSRLESYNLVSQVNFSENGPKSEEV